LGAVAAGDSVARLEVTFGWQGVFASLAVVSAVAALGAAYLLYLTARAAAAGKPVS
jgi:sugar phosphate permease